jgi:hypothetical protein
MILEITLGIILAIILIALFSIIITGARLLIIGLILILGLTLFFFSEDTDEKIHFAYLFILFGVFLFFNFRKSIREHGGMICFFKKVLLTLRPSFTITQKANKEDRLIGHSRIIENKVKLTRNNLLKRYYSKLETSINKHMTKYSHYPCFQINTESSTINISVANPDPTRIKDPFTVSLSVELNYPYSRFPTFILRIVSDWTFNIKTHKYRKYSYRLYYLIKHTRKLIKNKIIQYEAQIQFKIL